MYISMKESFERNPADIVGKARVVARNTFQFTDSKGWKITRLHLTDIIREKGKSVILDSGGWQTVTTKERFNRFAPCQVYQEKGSWTVYHGGKETPFYDGMNLNRINQTKANTKARAENKLKKQIAAFIKLIDPDNVPLPNDGDCWHCSMFAKITKPGQKIKDMAHLLEHIKEGYMHGSLILNALKWAGYQDAGIGLIFSGCGANWNLRNTVRRFLKAQLSLA